jgi:hypothetical protein
MAAAAGNNDFRAFIDAIDPAIVALKAVPEEQLGDGRAMRSKVYQLVQAQLKSANTDQCAFIKDLQCAIHGELIGSVVGHNARQKEAVTMPCGHSYCRGCILQWKQTGPATVCPICRAALPTEVQIQTMPKTVSIDEICKYLVPRVGVAGGGTRRRKRISNKRK